MVTESVNADKGLYAAVKLLYNIWLRAYGCICVSALLAAVQGRHRLVGAERGFRRRTDPTFPHATAHI